MAYKILKAEDVDFDDFVDFWKKHYADNNEHMYDNNIGKQNHNVNSLDSLFYWKNGGKLSKNKQKGIDEKIKSKINEINSLKQNYDNDRFEEEFKHYDAAIWKIFLKHIINPEKFPIFDQHVYRAFRYINKGVVQELPDNDKKKLELYKEYRQFLPKNTRDVDKAFFAFGQFIKRYSL